jgi:hypothetical protein
MSFDDLKSFNGMKYSGMSVGGVHNWNYPDGVWEETKVAPDRWKFKFTSLKRRQVPAPVGSGVPLKTQYHWYILGDQRVVKIDKDSYETVMEGMKYKIGHRRPYWKNFSYVYPGQMTYRQKLIQIFREMLKQLEEEEAGGVQQYLLQPLPESPLAQPLSRK